VGGNALGNSVFFAYSVIVSSLLYDALSCARFACTVMVEFHPINVGYEAVQAIAVLVCETAVPLGDVA
jgi:hypothetical protein